MKINHLVLAALAVLGMAACSKTEDLGPASVSVDTSELTFTQEGGSQTIKLASTIEWALKDYTDDVKEWVVIDPESGKGAKGDQNIVIKVLENTGADRSATITFYGNVLNKAVVTINQAGPAGDGTVDITVTDFVKTETYNTSDKSGNTTLYRITATASSNYSTDYNYIYISDGTTECEIYQPTNGAEWADKLVKGAKVTATGYHVVYTNASGKSIEELYGGEIIAVEAGESTAGEAKGTGTEADPFNASAANAAASKLSSGTASTDFYYIKGYVKGTPSISTSYGNANFYVIDTKDATTDAFYCYQVMYLAGAKFTSTDQLKEGDEVVVYAQLYNYNGTPETNGKGTGKLVSINGETSGSGSTYTTGTAKGTGTEADPYNATAALNIAKALETGASTADSVYVKGYVKGTPTFNGTYGDMTFSLVDEKAGTTEPLFVYQLLSVKGAKFTSATQLKDGDEIVLFAKLTNYNGTYETSKNGRTITINGSGDIDTGDSGSSTGSGDVNWTIGSGNQTWAAATDDKYGAGFSATVDDITVGYYKASSTSNAIAPSTDHLRVYKSSALKIKSTKTLAKVVMTCTASDKCQNLTGDGTSDATADATTLTITWTGSATEIALLANAGQVRIAKMEFYFAK